MAMNIRAGADPFLERTIHFDAIIQASSGGLHTVSIVAANVLEARDLVATQFGGGKLIHLFPTIVDPAKQRP